MSNIRESDGRVAAAESLYYNPHNKLDLTPEHIRPQGDRVLVRDLPEREKTGSLFIPESAQGKGMGKNGLLRLGLVVAVGPGDKAFERMVHKSKTVSRLKTTAWAGRPDGWRFPPTVKPGDRVLLDRRREAEFIFEGVRHTLCYEQQAILAVVHGGEQPSAGRCSQCRGSGESDKRPGEACRWCGGSGDEPPVELPMTLAPFYDKIVVKRDDDLKQVGSLYVPDNAAERTHMGTVLAVGSGWRLADGMLAPLDVKVGDRVAFGKFSGSDVNLGGMLDGREFLIMSESQVFGVVEG